MKQLLTILLAIWQLTSFGQGTQIVPIKRKSNGEILYYASTTRNKSAYPLTENGVRAFNNAVDAGAFRLSVMCPCGETGIIPVGTRPPVIPPCVTNCVSAPNWSSSWYDYDGNVLTVRATGADQTLRFERADGQAFTLSNPDGVPINNNTFYDHATLPGNVYQWQVYFPNAPQLKLTYKRKSDNATYVKTFTPAVGANNVNLFTAGSGGGTGNTCNLMVAVNSPTVNCGAAATLTATASGTSASGATYSWMGPNNFVASGASIVVATAQANGASQYTVTVSKNGCQASAVATVMVTGCQTTPQPTGVVYAYRGDNFNYVPLASTSTDDKFPAFETDDIKVTLALRNQTQNSTEPGMGGAIYQVYNKKRNPNHTLIYNPNRYPGDDGPNPVDRSGPPIRIFLGQGLTNCEYAGPRPFFTNQSDGAAGSSYLLPNGEKPGGTDGYLGFNPNEAGDDKMNSGRLLAYGRSGNTFYTKAAVPIYGQDGYYPPNNGVIMEKWGEVSGRAIDLHYQSTYNRNYAGRIVTKAQEIPVLYGNGLNVFKWYDGNSPYSGDGGVTTITIPGGSSPSNQNGVGKNGPRDFPLSISEPMIWMGTQDGNGMALITKDNSTLRYSYYGDGGFNASNPSMGGSYCSIGASPEEIIDNQTVWRHRSTVVFGTYEECRAQLYASSYRPDSRPRFKFNTAGREGWSMNSGDEPEQPGGPQQINTWDDKFNFAPRQGWKVYFSATADAEIYSPSGSWKAANFNKVYIRYKYFGKQTQWQLRFQRNKQYDGASLPSNSRFADENAIAYSNGAADVPGQKVLFPVNGNGEWQTAVIDLSNVPAWQGVITRLKIKPHVGSGSFQAGEYCIIDWVNTENADPFPGN